MSEPGHPATQPLSQSENPEPEAISQQVSSTSTQLEPNNEDSQEDPAEQDGCDSTTEVIEISAEDQSSPQAEVESTSEPPEPATEMDIIEDEASSCKPDKAEEGSPVPSDDNSSNNSESAQKTSRELKSILALSKEANLDTNLSSHRRKTLDVKDSLSPIHSAKKLKAGGSSSNFPVTAESELENFETKVEEKKDAIKRTRRSLLESAPEGATDSDSCGKSLEQGDFVMSKKEGKDVFCWRCHHDSVQIACETCPRAYHLRCLKQSIADMEHWPCPECVAILKAENTQTRSKALKNMTLEHLCSLLKYAVKRMIQCNGSEPFVHPVDEKQFPEYRNYIVQPMTLTMLQNNIRNNLYGSTQAFEADAKWIVHNSIIFNSSFPDQSKLTGAAKSIVKICKQEMAEIENCSSCYLNANTKKHTWFVEVCPRPHLLVWAKLKGFPYWPAKVMSINSAGMADVRFFGAHDKAWVSVKDCFLYSTKDPNSGKQKRNNIAECVKELELYVDNLKRAYGRVIFAPFRTPLDPDDCLKQLQMFLPGFKKGKDKLVCSVANTNKNLPSTSAGGSKISCNDTSEDVSVTKTCDSVQIQVKNGDEDSRDRPKVIDVKPKTVKPIKTIIIRKRYSSDNVVEHTVKFARRDPSKSEHKRLSLDNHVKMKITSPDVKISDQLMKKLEPVPKPDDQPVVEELKGHDQKVEEKQPDGQVEDKQNLVEEVVDQTISLPDGPEEDKLLNNDDDSDSVISVNKNDTLTEPDINLKKRKLSPSIGADLKDDDCSIFPPNKMVKLVPIENILQKKNEIVEIPVTSKPPGLIVFKEIKVVKNQTMNKANCNSSKSDGKKTEEKSVTIKNEIDSDDDSDIQYMEAKRQYLSALNISEKQKVPLKPKTHEIRTRSKTEEKNKSLTTTKSTPTSGNTSSDNSGNKTSDSSSNGNNTSNKEIYIKSMSKLQTPKHKARKSFPTPNYNNSINRKPIMTRNIVPRPTTDTVEEITFVNAATLQTLTTTTQSVTNVMILPKLHYNKPITQPKELSAPPMLTMLPRPPIELSNQKKPSADVSQNYIPQNEKSGVGSVSTTVTTAATTTSTCTTSVKSTTVTVSSGGILLNNLLAGGSVTTNVVDLEGRARLDPELGVLKEFLPESVTKGVSEILCQPPPKLKPKPVGLLDGVVEGAGVPSTAGPVASRINAMAQKLSDCFRGLLVETVNDLGKNDNPEAVIASLKLEIEELNHKHSIELSEIRRNVSIVLKDIQKTVVEERDRVINETKANCEIETGKKVEEAKSKQWCANCLKEAQFYCCWNTSYCDYPCQQKHWLKHMNKCTQTANQSPATSTPVPVRAPVQQPLVLTPTSAPKFGVNNLFNKPQKVYLKRSNTQFKQSPSGHITLVESAPGNFELVGSGPIAVNGKILASTSVIEKIKSGNIVTVQAPSTSNNTQLTSASQKMTVSSKLPALNRTNSSENEH